MRNWAVNTSQFNTKTPTYIKWKLEQLINFGLSGDKLAKQELIKYLPELSIDPGKRIFLEFILDND